VSALYLAFRPEMESTSDCERSVNVRAGSYRLVVYEKGPEDHKHGPQHAAKHMGAFDRLGFVQVEASMRVPGVETAVGITRSESCMAMTPAMNGQAHGGRIRAERGPRKAPDQDGGRADASDSGR